MDKKWMLFVIVFALVCFINSVNATDFEINGTVYDVNGTALNSANISVKLKDQTWTDLGTNSTSTNSTGWFNLTVPLNQTYMYQLSITHNDSNGAVDWVGQSLPPFPYSEFSRLSNVNFYLKEAGTMNITVINGTNDPVPNNQFAYQVKDQKLGYPLSVCSNSGNFDVVCYLPKERNYSIMIYPSEGSPQHFVPVSFEWNNFSVTSDYNIDSLSSYNATTRTLHKQFNVTESYARIYGYLNSSELGIIGWDEFTVVPFLLEPSNMIFMTYGKLPFNASAISGGQYATDEYNLTRYDANASGFYNITLPYASTETVRYILFAAAKNGTTYYGGYRNITVTADKELNFTMYGLLGGNAIINQSVFSNPPSFRLVNTSMQEFRLVNASNNQSLSNVNAHIETTVDYSNYGAIEFTFMEDLSGANNGNFSLPLLNVTGIKEMNVYSMSQAPKRLPTRTVAQINANNNITMSSFNVSDIDGNTLPSSISISLYRSNSTCDVPNPPTGCNLTSTANMDTFNPFSVVMGGGKISFRMGIGNVLVHYVDVDMLASGPPPAIFDSNDDVTEDTTDGFSKAMRFGSNGPTIYSYVLVSIPYTQGSSSTTGLNENGEVNISIPTFYDEEWNVIWNTSLNGTNATQLAGNYSHYSAHQSEWETLIGNNTCVVTTTGTSGINSSYPCHIDTTNNRIWIRLPHFSGTGPSISGSVITATTGDGTTTGGGGGGGGVTVNKTHKKTHTWTKITPGVAAIMKITDREIGFKQINITVKNPANTVTITVTKLEGKPATVVHEITGKVYKYIDVETKNLEDENVDEAKIEFEVNKSWISENNIDPETIALNRYKNGWEKLPTEKTGEDDDYVYYVATTTGFSTFAITGEVKAVVTTTTTTLVTTTTLPVTTTTLPLKEAIEGMPWIFGLIIVIIIVAIGFWLYRKKK